MKLKNWLSRNGDRDKKTRKEAGAAFITNSCATAEALVVNENSHSVDENGNVELNFDDSEVQRVLKKRLESLWDYDLAEDSTNI